MRLTNVLMFNLTEFLFYAFTKIICYVKLETWNDENFLKLSTQELNFKELNINFPCSKQQMSYAKLDHFFTLIAFLINLGPFHHFSSLSQVCIWKWLHSHILIVSRWIVSPDIQRFAPLSRGYSDNDWIGITIYYNLLYHDQQNDLSNLFYIIYPPCRTWW